MSDTHPERHHVVEAGDTLSGLAQHYYGSGDEHHWRRIYAANRELIGDDPDAIQPGQRLVIPPAGE